MSDKPRGLLLVMMDVDPAHDGDFNRWYDLDHVPERLGCPGFVSARRFEAVEGEPKYLALYELESLDALETPTYLRHLAEPTEWTTAIHGTPRDPPERLRRAHHHSIGRPARLSSSTMIGTAAVTASTPRMLLISITSRICSTVAPCCSALRMRSLVPGT